MKWLFENEEAKDATISGRICPVELSFDDEEMLFRIQVFKGSRLDDGKAQREPLYVIMDLNHMEKIMDLIKDNSIQNGRD